ncbi:hypothetical protein WA158_001625 [Blastocystis sp. Blastoise]
MTSTFNSKEADEIDNEVIKVVTQLVALSLDPDSQIIMAKEDGVMNGLLGYLDHANPKIRYPALKCVYNLAANPKNLTILKNRHGIIEKLKRESHSDDILCQNTAVDTMLRLRIDESQNTPKERKIVNYTYRFNNIRNPHLNQLLTTNILPIKGCISITVEKELHDDTANGTNDAPTYIDDLSNENEEKSETQLDTYGFTEYDDFLENKKKERKDKNKTDKKKKSLFSLISDSLTSWF